VIRLLLARGLPRSTAKRLVDPGSEVLHVADIGMAPSSDSLTLSFARRERRVCVTLDADFPTQLAVSGATGPSTIRIRVEGLRGPALTELLERIWPLIDTALEQGGTATITERNVRVHRLPIEREGA